VITAAATIKPLTPKQQLFVDEYMKDRNATQAYIRSGYSAKGANTHVPRLVANGPIAAEIARRRSTRGHLLKFRHMESGYFDSK